MRLFWSFTRQAFHNTVVYRVEFWMRLVSILLAMYSRSFLWLIKKIYDFPKPSHNLKIMLNYQRPPTRHCNA